MEPQPLVTVITITYNAAGVLARTMRSMAGQSARGYEHLIVDGASTDGTVALAESMPNPGLRIVSEPDRGIYDAMNKGLRLARGRYVLFLNAGDAFTRPDVLQMYMDAARTGADVVYADTLVTDPEGTYVRPRHLSAPEVLDAASFARGMLVCHQAFMVRRDLAGPYDTRYRFSADYDWCVACLLKSDPSRCVNLHTNAVLYLAEGTTDRNKIRSLRERFGIMCRRYGTLRTVANHISFVPRALARRLKKLRRHG